jgi:hypothetical protein
VPSETPERVLLVVIGAGAPYGCFDAWPSRDAINAPEGTDFGQTDWQNVRPPLTKNLLEANPYRNMLRNRYRQALPLIDELSETTGGPNAQPLEEALAAYQGKATYTTRR